MSEAPHHEMAIIEGIGVGMRDAPWPCIFFTVKLLHGGALQCIPLADERADSMLRSCYSIDKLEGKPCEVETDGIRINFVRLLE